MRLLELYRVDNTTYYPSINFSFNEINKILLINSNFIKVNDTLNKKVSWRVTHLYYRSKYRYNGCEIFLYKLEDDYYLVSIKHRLYDNYYDIYNYKLDQLSGLLKFLKNLFK